MMTCRELADLLLEFVANELAADQCLHVEEHMHACQHCAVYVQTYRLTIHIARQLPCSELPEHLRCLCEELLRQQGCGES